MTREVSRTWKREMIGRGRHAGSQRIERLSTTYCCRIDDFELWGWKRLLRVPWTARRLNQSILKEINPEYSLEGLMLKLKFQYLGHLMWRTDSLEKTLMLGKTRQEEKGTTEDEMVGWHHHLNGHEFEQTLGGGEGQGSLVGCSPCRWKELDTTEQLNSL